MNTHYIAIIGDLVGSRELSPAARARVQSALSDALQRCDALGGDDVVAQFVITTGDEFQGLVRTGTWLPEAMALIEGAVSPVAVRYGVGRGVLYTPLQPQAVGMDGPVWHQARAGIERAKSDDLPGGVFVGFGDDADAMMTGLAAMLRVQRDRWSDRQREIVTAARSDRTQADIGASLEPPISQAAVSKTLRAADWNAYAQGEAALGQMLRCWGPDGHGVPAVQPDQQSTA